MTTYKVTYYKNNGGTYSEPITAGSIEEAIKMATWIVDTNPVKAAAIQTADRVYKVEK